jgi:predicted transposase YdaD
LESVEAKNFSPEKIYGYELYVDSIRQYHTTLSLERKAGWKEGIEEGIAKGEEQGKQVGLETSLQIIQEIKKNILSPEEIAIQFNTNVEMVLSLKSLV